MSFFDYYDRLNATTTTASNAGSNNQSFYHMYHYKNMLYQI